MSTLLDRALRILSMRDHSEAELRRKLASQPVSRRRFPRRAPSDAGKVAETSEQSPEITQEQIDAAIHYCLENDWLNDTRFAQRYISSRTRKGYGEQRIRMELMQKGVDRESIDGAFGEAEIDRPALAKAAAMKKFGDPLPAERNARIKIQRYLLSRGFSFDDIRAIYINL